jgi:hypothetical protein
VGSSTLLTCTLLVAALPVLLLLCMVSQVQDWVVNTVNHAHRMV